MTSITEVGVCLPTTTTLTRTMFPKPITVTHGRIANFQTLRVAERYRDQARANGYWFTSMIPYRGGWQVHVGQVRYS